MPRAAKHAKIAHAQRAAAAVDMRDRLLMRGCG
jgi:hypothetical protein